MTYGSPADPGFMAAITARCKAHCDTDGQCLSFYAWGRNTSPQATGVCSYIKEPFNTSRMVCNTNNVVIGRGYDKVAGG